MSDHHSPERRDIHNTPHNHHGQEGDRSVAANKAHFDANAATYEENATAHGIIGLAKKLGVAALKEYAYDKDSTTVLDFACGTGFMSKELRPYAKSIVGVDVSQGMVDQYNKFVKERGIPPEQMKAVRAELKGEEGELEGAKFDLVINSMAFHHFEDIAVMTKIMAHFVRPGGCLLVCDFEAYDPAKKFANVAADSKLNHVIGHTRGFSEDVVKGVFEGAGLESFSMGRATSFDIEGHDIYLFMAKGFKPTSAAL